MEYVPSALLESAAHEMTMTDLDAPRATAFAPQNDGRVTYTATITTATLRLRESRIIAGLLIDDLTPEAWKHTLFDQNILQMGSPESISRIARLIRARLTPLGPDLWRMVRDGDRTQATQATLAGAILDSRLLGDFMDITMREQRVLFAPRLERRLWREYLTGCRGRDPDMRQWSETTINKLRSSVFSLLTQAGYLKDTRSLALQNVFIDRDLVALLERQGERYILRCMQVTE